MGKRSEFVRRKEDSYDTPYAAIKPLLPHLPPRTRFLEPCAGKGDMVHFLQSCGHVCVGAVDIKPREPVPDLKEHRYVSEGEGYYLHGIQKGDATKLLLHKQPYIPDMIITNPPWTRELLHQMIFNLYWQAPTWLLFDSDWKHTQQAKPYLPMLQHEISIGRVKWIPDTKYYSKDNCSWYLFHGSNSHTFTGRHF